jgi:hypothetical protein
VKKTSLIKWTLIGGGFLVISYIGSVVWFEARLGYNQPQNSSTIVIATFDDDGTRSERVVRLTVLDDKKYIAANHWPRAWYRQALDNPQLEVKEEDSFNPYVAVALQGDELEFVEAGYQVGFEFRFRTGFPPRRFLRLDPQYKAL